MFKRYYITASRKCLETMAKRLLYIQEPFSFNGGSTISFEIQADRERWIKGTFVTLERRSKSEGTKLEIESYEVNL